MKLFTALVAPRIDAENGIIRSVSLMEMGDARGHFDKKGRQVIIDNVTLDQLFKECKKLGKVKVKANHGSGVFEVIGWAENFALRADKVTADVHIYASEMNRGRILEIADQNPTHMGVSMEFTGEDKASGTVSLSRCDGVIAAALVDDPAANRSLFSAKEEETESKTKTNTMEDETTEPTLADLMSKFEEIEARMTALEAPPEEEKPDDAPEPEKELEEEPEPEKELSELPEGDNEKKIELAAQRGAEIAIKAMTAKLGLTKLGKPGTAKDATAPKVKTYSDHVEDLAKEKFDGDRVKAEGHILTNFAKFPEAKKAYEASRNVKTA
jgi:hypothetical protein